MFSISTKMPFWPLFFFCSITSKRENHQFELHHTISLQMHTISTISKLSLSKCGVRVRKYKTHTQNIRTKLWRKFQFFFCSRFNLVGKSWIEKSAVVLVRMSLFDWRARMCATNDYVCECEFVYLLWQSLWSSQFMYGLCWWCFFSRLLLLLLCLTVERN